MAKRKAAGAGARQKTTPAGKRLGLKVNHGQAVKAGQILVRQRGSTYHPGPNVGVGKDYTLYAEESGRVQFGNVRKGKKKISIAADQ